MMEARGKKKSVEFRAKNMDLAIEKGLDDLGLTRDQVEVQVIKSGSRGVLGIGAGDAVVSLTYVEAIPETAPVVTASESVVTESLPVQESPQTSQASAAFASEADYSEAARSVLEELLTRMQVKAHVEIAEHAQVPDEQAESVTLNVTGDDLGILIGRRGETLRDLQFITRLIVSRQIQRWPNVIVDIEFYKARREKLLKDLALRMAERVRLNPKPITLEPMPAHERRIIHISLRDFPSVYTESTGEGQARKVVIMPKL